jgi:hypothetical protein
MTSTSQPRHRATLIFAAAMCLAASGCHKKIRVPPLPPAPPPVLETVTIPPPTHHTDELPQVETPPPAAITPPAQQKPRPRRPRKPAARPTDTATVNAPALPGAPATTVDPSPIGELTTGGEAGTQGRQETESLLNTVQKRLDHLSDEIKKAHQEQVERVRLFVKRAQDAWKTGDLEGARTLATKANVLLDDILR